MVYYDNLLLSHCITTVMYMEVMIMSFSVTLLQYYGYSVSLVLLSAAGHCRHMSWCAERACSLTPSLHLSTLVFLVLFSGPWPAKGLAGT